MELASLVTAIGVCAAFLLGFMLCKYETRGVIHRLTYQNEILLECLMNRVGFTPKRSAPAAEPSLRSDIASALRRDKTTTITNPGPISFPDDLPAAPRENIRPIGAEHAKPVLPDLFQRRQAAFEKDKNIGNLTI